MGQQGITEQAFKTAVSEIYAYIRGRLATELGEMDEERNYDASCDASASLIMDGGFGPDDSDLFGSQMSDTVQTLLQCAIMLQPDMLDMWAEKHVVA